MSDLDKLNKSIVDHENRIKRLENLVLKSPVPKKKSSKIGILDLIIEIKGEGFFDKQKTRKEIVDKLTELGHIYPPDSFNKPLLTAVKRRILGRVKMTDGQWGYVKR